MKLSELEAGKQYRIDADGVEAIFTVITEGSYPMVLMIGGHDISMSDLPTTKLVQLITTRFFDDVMKDGLSFLTPDGLVDGESNLYGIAQGEKSAFELVYIACSPDISLIEG